LRGNVREGLDFLQLITPVRERKGGGGGGEGGAGTFLTEHLRLFNMAGASPLWTEVMWSSSSPPRESFLGVFPCGDLRHRLQKAIWPQRASTCRY